MVAASAVSRAGLRQVAQAARTSMPVLSPARPAPARRSRRAWSTRGRAARPFVPINCAAIPNELMEGELFGYARGAFSGAVRGYAADVAAKGGTVFLDEIDDTPTRCRWSCSACSKTGW